MMKKKLTKAVTILLILTTIFSLSIPAFATTTLSTTAPSTPSGFHYLYSVNRNKTFEMAISGTAVTLLGLIPGAGYVSAAIAVSQIVAASLDSSSLPSTYVDYVYEAADPEINYGVPYVYWHRLKFTFNIPGGGTYIRWTSYYEYAVAPRGIANEYE